MKSWFYSKLYTATVKFNDWAIMSLGRLENWVWKKKHAQAYQCTCDEGGCAGCPVHDNAVSVKITGL